MKCYVCGADDVEHGVCVDCRQEGRDLQDTVKLVYLDDIDITKYLAHDKDNFDYAVARAIRNKGEDPDRFCKDGTFDLILVGNSRYSVAEVRK